MKVFSSVKQVQAEPSSYYNYLENYKSKSYRDVILQKDVVDKQGYIVKYEDGEVVWIPKETFERNFA